MRKILIATMAITTAHAQIQQELPKPDAGAKVVRSQSAMKSVQGIDNGLIKAPSKRAQELLKQKIFVPIRMANAQKLSTELNADLNAVGFAFEFPAIKSPDATKTWGYAQGGVYADGQWTGGVQLFESNAGSCALTVNAIKLSHAAANIVEEIARYDVNGKITTEFVAGDDKTGYVYIVSWFDDVYFRTLECANKKYSPEIMAEVVGIAVRGDK